MSAQARPCVHKQWLRPANWCRGQYPRGSGRFLKRRFSMENASTARSEDCRWPGFDDFQQCNACRLSMDGGIAQPPSKRCQWRPWPLTAPPTHVLSPRPSSRQVVTSCRPPQRSRKPRRARLSLRLPAFQRPEPVCIGVFAVEVHTVCCPCRARAMRSRPAQLL
jgi:hypothetical protein